MQLIEWLVPQSSSVTYVPAIVLAAGIGGIESYSAKATAEGHRSTEKLQAQRADKRLRKIACRDAMVDWLYAQDATNDALPVRRDRAHRATLRTSGKSSGLVVRGAASPGAGGAFVSGTPARMRPHCHGGGVRLSRACHRVEGTIEGEHQQVTSVQCVRQDGLRGTGLPERRRDDQGIVRAPGARPR